MMKSVLTLPSVIIVVNASMLVLRMPLIFTDTKIINFSVPQVLFLDDNKSKNEYFTIKGVYHIDEKEELFANIGTFQIEQSVNHNSEICQYNGRLDLGCERCIEVCEYKAIQ